MKSDLSSFISSPDGAVHCCFAWGLLLLGVEKDEEIPKTRLEHNGTRGATVATIIIVQSSQTRERLVYYIITVYITLTVKINIINCNNITHYTLINSKLARKNFTFLPNLFTSIL